MVDIRLKKQNGFTGADIMISIMVIIIFISIITTIGYQIYANSQAIERNAQATSYAIEILEKVDKLQYDDVTNENLYPTSDVPTGYTISIDVVKYNETEGNTDKEDLVKTVNVSISYKLLGEDQTVEMKRIKSRER